MLVEDPVCAIRLPNEVTTRDCVDDPTIWLDTGLLARDIEEEVFGSGNCPNNRPEETVATGDTGLIVS